MAGLSQVLCTGNITLYLVSFSFVDVFVDRLESIILSPQSHIMEIFNTLLVNTNQSKKKIAFI